MMETGFGIGPKTCHARQPNGVEARGRRQPTEPVNSNTHSLVTLLHPHYFVEVLHPFHDMVRRAPMADLEH